jgi:predicted nucleic acid-binding protein
LTAIDTNVLLDIAIGEEPFAARAMRALDGVSGGFSIAPVVVAELFAHPGWDQADVEPFVAAVGANVAWALERATWLCAAEAFAAYAGRRRKSGSKDVPRRLIADFLIGAHATSVGSLITRDAAFFRRAFPTLVLIEPH